MTHEKALQTIAASNGVAADSAYGAAAPPIYLSSTFAFKGFERPGGHEYTRTSNPTRDLLADTLAKLEGGAGAVTLSSGMAAINLLLDPMERDDLVIAPHDCYSGVQRLLSAHAAKGHFKVEFVDQSDAEAVATALGRNPKLLMIETPSNPLMRVVDIRAFCEAAKKVGAKVAVDNTFLSPALQRPIPLGADFVVHSMTKFLNGHSDVVGGAVICASESDAEEMRGWANITGVTGSPFDSYLTLRGLRTLFPRLERQQRTAETIALFLQQHPSVEAVHYPGLVSHPSHALAKAQQAGFGAMLSFEVAGGIAAVRRLVESVRIFTLAESLGGVESLIAHPATMTHASMAPEARAAAGIKDNLLRLSVGLEHEGDLVSDLAQALKAPA
ncbi:O-succinylhomoserine (thiol)-lyase [Methylocella silvestris BL2]|uniref:L-methionine gamma-lyase n=1 Tax=Methylocella silvestris (strain DSM 15510 / CIP 108128 / LMG 27833 / NCIMB 13906 / BL2) TaxID=395965 RepID=B8EQN6_METSB|nr:cystathionine gamma-synthase [Methylocella silvestris]ACK49307.1 O-succinylhomoserine (thiol)-lyase [Methylocella silvestris BL2]